MSQSKVCIKVADYFQFNFQLVGYGALLASLLTFQSSIPTSLTLSFFGIIIVTTQYKLEVDTDEKEFFEYLWILGVKRGQRKPYEKVESVHIVAATNYFTYVSKYSDSMMEIGQPRSGKESVYKAMIRFKGSNENVYIGEKSSLKQMKEKCQMIAKLLAVPLFLDE